MRGPIEVDEAISMVLDGVSPLGKESCPLNLALGRVIADDMTSPITLPGFRSSAMDGYALRTEDLTGISDNMPVTLRIVDAIYAGDDTELVLGSKEAALITTGAMVPPGADAVVKKEDVETNGNELIVRTSVSPGENIREPGEDVRAGELAVPKGTKITPFIVIRLSSLGFAHVPVYKLPTVVLISSGNELVEAGITYAHTHIYDSNRPGIRSALRMVGITPVVDRLIPDDVDALIVALEEAMDKTNIVILTGGISTGERDFSKEALYRLGIVPSFHGIKQKPGKPMYYARIDDKHIFGLPGNPVSSVLCFYIYVYPVIRALSGYPDPQLPRIAAETTSPIKAKPGRITWFPGRVSFTDGTVKFTPDPKQGSHIISSLVGSDAVGAVPGKVDVGEKIRLLLMPWAS